MQGFQGNRPPMGDPGAASVGIITPAFIRNDIQTVLTSGKPITMHYHTVFSLVAAHKTACAIRKSNSFPIAIKRDAKTLTLTISLKTV